MSLKTLLKNLGNLMRIILNLCERQVNIVKPYYYISKVYIAKPCKSSFWKELFISKNSIESTLEDLQNLLKEPIKYLKNPHLNSLAIQAIKDPSLEFLVEVYGRLGSKIKYRRISKDFSKEICYNVYKRLLDKTLKDSSFAPKSPKNPLKTP